jgi:hypothetical protein
MLKRTLLIALLVAMISLMTTSAQAEPWSVRGFVFGEIDSADSGFGFTSMGFAHRVKDFQIVAVFRGRNRVYHPVAVLKLERVDATKSLFRNSKTSPVKAGDLVVALERDMVPITTGDSVEESFVRTNIITRGYRNGYDSGIGSQIAGAFRDQSHELRTRRSANWEESFGRTRTVKQTAETDPRRALTLQLEFYNKEVRSNPKSFGTVSQEWRQVLTWLDPKVDVVQLRPTVNSARILRTARAFRPEYDEEAAQFFAVLISKATSSSHGSLEAYLKVSFLHSQFGNLLDDDRLIKDIVTYIQELSGQEADSAN